MLADSVFETPIVISNHDYRFLVAEQLQKIKREARIVLEPIRRDSGPAVAVAAELAAQSGPDTIVAVLAADHVVRDGEGFVALCKTAAEAAALGYIVTLGIKPDTPATGYGYIKPGKTVTHGRRRVEGRGLRRKAQCRHGARNMSPKLSLEFRQFLFPRRCDAGRVAEFRAGHGGSGRGSRRQGETGFEFSGPRQGSLREGAEKIDRLRGHGAHRQGRGRPRRHRLVGCRQLGGGLAIVGTRRQGQFDPGPRRRHECVKCSCPLRRTFDDGRRRRRCHCRYHPGCGLGAQQRAGR